MALNDFDFVAPFYERLASLVFGKALIHAQITHLSEIKEDDNVLILGGGTGEILDHIPICENIDYVEKSHLMIRRAKSRLVNRPVNFIQEDFLIFHSERKYDVIICPFFLDCFEESNLKQAIGKCKHHLKSGGKLIIIDFESGQTNSFLLRLMHLFFRLGAQLESRKLKNIHNHVLSIDFKLLEEKFSHRNQLFSRLYRNL